MDRVKISEEKIHQISDEMTEIIISELSDLNKVEELADITQELERHSKLFETQAVQLKKKYRNRCIIIITTVAAMVTASAVIVGSLYASGKINHKP
jgi:ABC-type uncharacterized transport system ATPase subunit